MAGLSEEVSKSHSFSADGQAERKIRKASWGCLWHQCLTSHQGWNRTKMSGRLQAGGVICEEKERP
jgi:hypothetical protein